MSRRNLRRSGGGGNRMPKYTATPCRFSDGWQCGRRVKCQDARRLLSPLHSEALLTRQPVPPKEEQAEAESSRVHLLQSEAREVQPRKTARTDLRTEHRHAHRRLDDRTISTV